MKILYFSQRKTQMVGGYFENEKWQNNAISDDQIKVRKNSVCAKFHITLAQKVLQ